ncbi:uncharacterized protein LOC126908119 [Daktulosphaira vitifoliae]|uniref:uncharacterized protein LOC126908119 n=1 Tax=Daktulosphaira vitifoliae TaxID=58002 RepID=UPI0021AA89A8|nr:uncharacterized protein LOC126908119 [Daktulosphaira vitifoliae]
MASKIFIVSVFLITTIVCGRSCPTEYSIETDSTNTECTVSSSSTIRSSSSSSSSSVSIVKTSSGKDIFDVFSKYNKDQLCAFYKEKNLSSIENLYLDYIKNTSDSTKLTAYKDALYKHYSKESSIDTVITELKEIVSSVTSSSSSSSSSSVTKSVSIVKTSKGEDIFDLFNDCSNKDLLNFFKERDMKHITNLFVQYKKKETKETKVAFRNGLYEYYQNNKNLETDITKIRSICSSNSFTSVKSTSSCISVVKTSKGEDIFDLFNDCSNKDLLNFFKERDMKHITNLFVQYKKNETKETKVAFRNGLYEYYQNNKNLETDITKIRSICSSNSFTSVKSTSSCISVVKTSKGEDIFDLFNDCSNKDLLNFFKERDMKHITNLFVQYKKNETKETKVAFRNGLYEYYQNNKNLETDITKIRSFCSSNCSSCKSKSHTQVCKKCVSKDSKNSSSDESKSNKRSVVRNSNGKDIFNLFNNYNQKQLCAFFKKKGMSELEKIYVEYKNCNSGKTKKAFKCALYNYYSKHLCVDTDLAELKEFVKTACSSNSNTKSSSISKSISVVKTSSGEDIFDLLKKYNKDQLCAFFKKKRLSNIEKHYLDYIKCTSNSAKLSAYKKAVYDHYSNNKCIDTDVNDLKEFVKTFSSSSSSSTSVSKSVSSSGVMTSSGKDIFDVFDDCSEDKVVGFFNKKGLADIASAYKRYKSSVCEKNRNAFRDALYKYYSCHSCVELDVKEFNSYSSATSSSTSSYYSANEVSSCSCSC